MSTKSDQKEFRLDALKWLIVLALAAAAILGNTYYSSEPLLYRVLAMLALAIVACLVAVNTAKGNGIWRLMQESLVEVRKVVWPTRQETHQTTLIVLAVVIVTAVILWGLDAIFGWIASGIIG